MCDSESAGTSPNDFDVWYMSDRHRCSGWCVDYSQKPIRAVEIEAVSINVFLMQCSKCEMSGKRLMFAKPPPCKTCGMSLKTP